MTQQPSPNTKLLADLKSLFMKDGSISPYEKAEYTSVADKLKKLGVRATQEDVAEAVMEGIEKQNDRLSIGEGKGEDSQAASDQLGAIIKIITTSKLKSRGRE